MRKSKELLIESLTGYSFEKIVKKKFPEYLEIFKEKEISLNKDLSVKMDKRTSNEYIKELIYGWIIEDFLIHYLSGENISLEKNGSDKERKVLRNSQVTSSEDIYCKINNKPTYIEVISDFKSFWKKTGKAHLRQKKLPNLLKRSKKEDVYILFVDIENKKMGLLKIDSNTMYKYIDSHPSYGGKEVYEITVPILKNMEKEFLSREFSRKSLN